MALRDAKPHCYEVDPQIVQRVDLIERWIAGEIDDLVYDAYMKGRRDQAVSNIYMWMRECGEPFSGITRTLLLRLPPEYEITETDIERFAMNFNTGYYSSLMKSVRRLMQSMQKSFEEIKEVLNLDEYGTKIYQAAENVADEKLEQFVWTYLQREKPPSYVKRRD